MDRMLIVMASVGLCLLWERATPIQPLRSWLTIRLNRWWEWMVVGRWKVCKALAWPLRWLKGVLACGECKSPYVGFLAALALHERWPWAIVMGLATYALFVSIFGKRDHA